MLRDLFALGLGLCLLLSGPTHAQNTAYPARPIKFIVPITPGGSNDVVARVIAQKLTEQWGQAVTVDNRPGAGMNLGADLVAKSPPDGYTWLLGANNIFVTNPHVGKTPFDVFKDFTPISQVALVPFVLVVHPSVPAKNVAELVAYAKANPDKLNYGSSGNGSPQQLASEMLNHAAGIQMQHVPYKGAVPAITDLLGGRIQVFIGAVNSLLPHIKEGKLRRIFRIVGQRANFSIWEAASLEELHATLLSLPMHPFFDVEVTPLIEHSTTQAWNAANGEMPPF